MALDDARAGNTIDDVCLMGSGLAIDAGDAPNEEQNHQHGQPGNYPNHCPMRKPVQHNASSRKALPSSQFSVVRLAGPANNGDRLFATKNWEVLLYIGPIDPECTCCAFKLKSTIE